MEGKTRLIRYFETLVDFPKLHPTPGLTHCFKLNMRFSAAPFVVSVWLTGALCQGKSARGIVRCSWRCWMQERVFGWTTPFSHFIEQPTVYTPTSEGQHCDSGVTIPGFLFGRRLRSTPRNSTVQPGGPVFTMNTVVLTPYTLHLTPYTLQLSTRTYDSPYDWPQPLGATRYHGLR